MIIINKLVKTYNNFKLEIEDLIIKNSQLVGLVGNNGAGKTTLLRLITNLIKRDTGNIHINDSDVIHENWKKEVGIYLDENFLIDFLSPLEYFSLIANLKEKKKYDDALLLFNTFLTSDILNDKKLIREYSKGNKQKIGIVGAFIGNPSIIILDEPHANLDPSSQIILQEVLLKYSQMQDKTVIVSSHNLNFVTDICSRILLVDNGQISKDYITDLNTINLLKSLF